MRTRPRKTYLVYGITLILLLGVISQLLGPIKWTREAEGTDQSEIFVELQPGEFVSTLLLAGFRAVAVDLVWVRAMNAQQEGQWHEIVLLMNFIQRLQPRFSEAYIFNGWNMAYNISHEIESLDEKWGWIMEGYNLLRVGARRNPHLYKVKFWAGWILYDKIAQNLDQEQRVYFTQKYMKENNGRHPLRDAAIWFERAYRTPGEQLWAHRTMMAHAYARLAEFHYMKQETGKLRQALQRMFQQIDKILKQDPENEVVLALAHRWIKSQKTISQSRDAFKQLGPKTKTSITTFKRILKIWDEEFKDNPSNIIANSERAWVAQILADYSIKERKDKEVICDYLMIASESLKMLSRYSEYDQKFHKVQQAQKKHNCLTSEK